MLHRVTEPCLSCLMPPTGHDNGDIRLWDLDTGPWATLQQHTNTVTSLVLAIVRKNEELLISGECSEVLCTKDGWFAGHLPSKDCCMHPVMYAGHVDFVASAHVTLCPLQGAMTAW